MAKKKQIKWKIKLHIPAGKATPAPPVGPALGPTGINIPEFCKQFNAKTANMGDYIIPVVLYVYSDHSFTFETKTPPTSDLLRKIAKIEKGSGEPNRQKVARITREQLRQVAEKKLSDLNTDDIEVAMKIVAGTARSMGIEIVD